MSGMKRLCSLAGLLILPAAVAAQQPPIGLSLNSPNCVRVPEARGEEPADEELGVGRKGEYCAYPLRMMAYHRIVNDHLGGPPILVSYDPDTGSGRVFDPVLEGKEYHFDAAPSQAGLPEIKDRETGSVWSALTGEARSGSLAGKRLARLPSLILTWGRWKSLHPDSWVLAEDSKLGSHYVVRTTPPACALPSSAAGVKAPPAKARLAPATLTLGISAGGKSAALPLTDHYGRYPTAAQSRDVRVGDQKVALFLDPVAHAAVAFAPLAKGKSLHFSVDSKAQTPEWSDRETGSRWSLEGRCTEGPLKGEVLEPVDAVRVRWYAWSMLHPDSALLRSR